MGVAGKVYGPAARTVSGGSHILPARAAGVVAGTGAELATQGVAGAVGEAGGQIAATGEVENIGEVVVEGVAGAATAAADVPTAAFARGNLQGEPAPTPAVDPAPQPDAVPNDTPPVPEGFTEQAAPETLTPVQEDLPGLDLPRAEPQQPVAPEPETPPVAAVEPEPVQPPVPSQDGEQLTLLDAVETPPVPEGFTEQSEPETSSLQLQDAREISDPEFSDVSASKGRSIYEEAYQDAGLSPDEGVLLKPEQQRNVLARATEKKFGFQVDLKSNVPTVDAQNQMLDGYRNMRWMSNTLGLPANAMSLGGRLNLSLERANRSYLGMYDLSTRTVHMPGRSNSFAHEWFHALDHYLLDQVKPQQQVNLLSRVARADGLDPKDDIQSAFINLVHSVMFDDADLAVQALRVEQEANATIKQGPNKGAPTKAALAARNKLANLYAGMTRVRIRPTDFRTQSATYGMMTSGDAGAQYFGSVHEMLARAFEAYVAKKVKSAGGTNEFITKSDEAYLSDADTRLRYTFPKAEERDRIFLAFDKVFDQLRAQQLLGAGSVETAPDGSAIYDPHRYNNALIDNTPNLDDEVRGAVRAANRLIQNPTGGVAEFLGDWQARTGLARNNSNLPSSWHELAAGVARTLSGVFGSIRGNFALAAALTPEGKGRELLRFVSDRSATKAGTGREITRTFETERNQITNRLLTRLESAVAQTLPERSIKAEDNKVLIELMQSKQHPGAKYDKHRQLAAEMRRIMTDVFTSFRDSGGSIGYVENTGYVPRILAKIEVEARQSEFLDKATQVYRIALGKITDAEILIKIANQTARNAGALSGTRPDYKPQIRALKADPNNAALRDALFQAIADEYSVQAAQDWLTRVIAGDSFTYDSHGPGHGQYAQGRTLPPEADKILGDAGFYENDAIDLVANYVQRMTAATVYNELFGLGGGNSDLRTVVTRRDNKARVAQAPLQYDLQTEQGMLNVIRDLADPKRDNLVELALQGAGRLGAPSISIAETRRLVEQVSGRAGKGGQSQALNGFAHMIYVIGTIVLLPRSVFSSLVEPVNTVFRTGDVRIAAKNMVRTLQEIKWWDSEVKKRAAVARSTGIMASAINDAVAMNRVGGDVGANTQRGTILPMFFRANGQLYLTNAQSRAVMQSSYEWIASTAARIKLYENPNAPKADLSRWDFLTGLEDPIVKKAEALKLRADLRELGVSDADMNDFIDMVVQNPAMPDPAYTPTSAKDKAFEAVRQRVVYRMVNEVVINPTRADKPDWVNSSWGRLVGSLTSFMYAFYNATYGRTIQLLQRDFKIYQEAGADPSKAAVRAALGNISRLVAGFALIWVGQFMTAIVREWLFNSEKFDEMQDEDELFAWLSGLATSRSGVYGPADVLFNTISGLRYQRDITSLTAGAYAGHLFNQVQAILGYFSENNSPNSNTAERNMVKGIYNLTAAPAFAALISAMPANNPLSYAARFYGLTELTSRDAAEVAADVVVGEPTKR